MANEWILDVLDDLTEFAAANGLHALERRLLLARNTAGIEVSGGIAPGAAPRGLEHAGSLHRPIAGGPRS